MTVFSYTNRSDEQFVNEQPLSAFFTSAASDVVNPIATGLPKYQVHRQGKKNRFRIVDDARKSVEEKDKME